VKLVRPKELHSSTARNTAPYPDVRAGPGEDVAVRGSPGRSASPPPGGFWQPASSAAPSAASAHSPARELLTCIVIPPNTPVQRDPPRRTTPDNWGALRIWGEVRRIVGVGGLRPMCYSAAHPARHASAGRRA